MGSSEATVYRGFTRKQLDHEYSPSQWSQRFGADKVISEHRRVTKEGTQEARKVLGDHVDLDVPFQYPTSSGGQGTATLDIYRTPQEDAASPVLYFIHGGYWQAMSKNDAGYMAPGLAQCGINTVVVEYDIAPKGDLDTMVAQCRAGLAFTVARFSGHPVYVCGHSAGAQLAAMCGSTDWQAWGAPEVGQAVKGLCLVSGVYDLEPIMLSYVDEPLHLTPEAVIRNSPQHPDFLKHMLKDCMVHVVVGQHDPPEFHRQSSEYYQAVAASRRAQPLPAVCLTEVGGYDHFDVMEGLGTAGHPLTKLVLGMLGRS
eukprot:comp24238_c0_seq1/m.44808 comp24238_c0_seq1/g.44808  ORF comp24238_c0_seq1/g.44808 comp24238_c0_seq1/m.44808 type:complete len:313 (-) comp24238_c0_seq1:418-1356(-)